MLPLAQELLTYTPVKARVLVPVTVAVDVRGSYEESEVKRVSEALHFAGRSGLDVARVVDVISQGAAQSWQMDNRASTMLEGRYDFGFAVDWMRKDLAIALEEAARCGADLTITALVDQLYAQIQARGDGRLDTSSLLTLLE